MQNIRPIRPIRHGDQSDMTTQEERLLDFARRQTRAAARPVKRRGTIDPRCRLPPLAKLLAIDAAEEQAVAQARIDGGERKRAGTTAETLDGCGQGAGTGGPTGSLDRPQDAASGTTLA